MRSFIDEFMSEQADSWIDSEEEKAPVSRKSEEPEYEEEYDDEEEDPVVEIFREVLDELAVIRKTLQDINSKMGSGSVSAPLSNEMATPSTPDPQVMSILSQPKTPTMEAKQALDDVNALL